MDEEDKPVLGYETPPPVRHLSAMDVIGAALGILLGLFSLMMGFYGIEGAGYVIIHDFIRHLGGVNTGSDCFGAILFLLIAAFCGFISFRWIRGIRGAAKSGLNRKP